MDTIATDGVAGQDFRGETARARRRKSYTLEEKQRLVAESYEPGASASLVARRHDINANLLFTWRRQMRPPASATSPLELIPVEVISSAPTASPAAVAGAEQRGMIEVILVSGERVRVDAAVSEAALRRVLSALKALT
ncbi:IS66-like element accessory protein TnpA [Mesorhizobium sp. AaZ16]|uniref:IS66-like element accessory protein TnpA n=1 Tax=Mesorhizobium sp. AaZ16 TaxID=3402289 RepID=UPI00374E2EF3